MLARVSVLLALCARAGAAMGQSAETAAAQSAEATMPGAIGVVPIECDALGIDTAALLQVLRAELAEDGIGRVSAIAAADAAVGVARVSFEVATCDAGTVALTIVIDDAATRKSVRRSVELSGVQGTVRTRVVGLAIAELLRASWAELMLSSAPLPAVAVPEGLRRAMRLRLLPPAEVRAVPVVVAPVRRPVAEAPLVSALTFAALAEARASMFAPVAMGGRLVGALSLRAGSARLRLRLDAGGSSTRVDDRYGFFSLSTIDAGLAFGVSAPTRGFALDAALRLGLGYGYVGAQSTTEGVIARSDGGVNASLGALLTLRARAASWLWVVGDVEVFFTFVSVRATSVEPAPMPSRSVLSRALADTVGPGVALRVGLAWGD